MSILDIDGSGEFTLVGVLTGRAWDILVTKKVDGVLADFVGEHKVTIYEDRDHVDIKTELTEGSGLTKTGAVITFGQTAAQNKLIAKTYFAEMEDVTTGTRILKFEIRVERSL